MESQEWEQILSKFVWSLRRKRDNTSTEYAYWPKLNCALKGYLWEFKLIYIIYFNIYYIYFKWSSSLCISICFLQSSSCVEGLTVYFHVLFSFLFHNSKDSLAGNNVEDKAHLKDESQRRNAVCKEDVRSHVMLRPK